MRKSRLERCLPLLAVAAFCLCSAALPAQAGTTVYLMRGLMDVSTGLDELATQLKRRGINAIVASYTDKEELTAAAIRDHKSGRACAIVIVGHSLGADAGVDMAENLKAEGIRVALMITFSSPFSRNVPSNVARVVNYYQSDSLWQGTYIGLKGSVRNVDLAKNASLHHFNIEKDAKLHSATLSMISAAAATCGASKVQANLGGQ